MDAHLRSPYLMQSAFTIERQLAVKTTLAITYTNSRGVHELRSLDTNAPLPGTFNSNSPGSAVYPFGNPNPLFLMTSSGVYNQNQLIFNFNSQVNKRVSLTGSYTFNHARSDTDGLGTFPANPYDYQGEYGPASTDIHHRVSLGGTINTRWNLRFSPLVNLQSGAPFEITAGNDPFGTTLFNARPGIGADPSKPGLIQTAYGLLDPNPVAGEPLLSRNFGRGPGQMSVNLRVGKTIAFGPEIGKAWRSPVPSRDLHVGPQPSEPYQPRTDHRRHHLALVRPRESSGRFPQRRRLLRERQQPASGDADQVYVLSA